MKNKYIIPTMCTSEYITAQMCTSSNCSNKPGHGYGDDNHNHEHWKDFWSTDYEEKENITKI